MNAIKIANAKIERHKALYRAEHMNVHPEIRQQILAEVRYWTKIINILKAA